MLKSQIITLNSIQVFGHYLAAAGKLLHDPAEAIRLPREPKRLPGTILTPAEMKKLLAQPDTATVLGFRDRTLYEVLYSTGLRIMEAIRLRVPDVPPSLSALAGPELRRAGNLSSVPEGCIFVHAGKGGKDRVVPLGRSACRYLAEYVKDIRPLLLSGLASLRENSSDTVFLDRLGHPFSKSGILKKLAIYATRAGIKSEIRRGGKRITVHTFRHTLATEMLRHGADLRQIQELLGHANLRTTQIYTHIVKGELKRVQEQCHPREQTQLPEGFVRYRGRKFLTDEERHKDRRSKATP
jgi:integrase/recombinase XerD